MSVVTQEVQRIATEYCPCDDCPYAKACARGRLACRRALVYCEPPDHHLDGRRFTLADRAAVIQGPILRPDRASYMKLFPEEFDLPTEKKPGRPKGKTGRTNRPQLTTAERLAIAARVKSLPQIRHGDFKRIGDEFGVCRQTVRRAYRWSLRVQAA